ncbi:MAG: hypothetical protein AAFU79_31160 [Myxococcota bacterium]
MSIQVASRRRGTASLEREFPSAEFLDVTSKAAEPWVRFSPFYPHGGIPVPHSEGVYAESVEGIWQALKVFESQDIDVSKLSITSMKGLKRTVRRFGRVVGHREGVQGERILGYIEARRALYLPSYRFILERRLQEEISDLRARSTRTTIVLLDYETNVEIEDTSRPLSHAGLVAAFLNGDWPK